MDFNAKSITIVTVCDNQYCVMLAALIKSIELNTIQFTTVNVYVVDDGISKANIGKLKRSTGAPITLKFIDIKDAIKNTSSLPLDSSSFPLNVYLRLFISEFLPQQIERAIYLDVDMIVKKDLSELWNLAMDDNKIIAAVKDRCETIGSSWGGIRNYEALGLNPDAHYFNSGLLVIDIKAWRKTNLTYEVLKCISANKAFANFPDQYGLNVVFVDQWFELDARWNAYATADIEDPFIIHFIGRKPIFSTYNYNQAYSKEFFQYLELTEWKNYKLLKEHNRLLKKLTSVLIKKAMYIINWR